MWTEDRRVRLEYSVELGGWTVEFADILALRADGRVVAWGQNASGQTNVPGWLTNAVAVAAAGEAFADIAGLGFDKAMTRWNAKAREDNRNCTAPPESPGGNILLAPGASSGGSISRKEARSQDDNEEV